MLSALDGASVWLNSEPLTAAGLRGRVVLVDFWTYSCVNWLRTLPYLRAWAERYHDDGLVIVGAHAPEFGFEHKLDNVRWAVSELGVSYPVVIDNEFAIWRAFDNHYWPAVYLLDGEGRLRFQHFGEGAYSETERAVQELLGAGAETSSSDVVAAGVAEAADWDRLRSPETYLGYARGERRTDRPAEELALNEWSLTGDWSRSGEEALLDSGPGTIAYRADARDVNLVMAPPADASLDFRVTLDGEAPGESHGVDVDAAGAGVLAEPRMYQLVRQDGGAQERTFEIAFDGPGVHAYVFTFG